VNENHSPNPAEMLALERFGLITKIQDALHQQIPLGQAIQQAASASIDPLSPRTLEDWWYAYKKGGFAALHPKERCDRGQHRKCTPEQKKLILEQVQSTPHIPLTVLYRRWREKDPLLPSLTTVYRVLEQNQLNHKQRRAGLFPSMSGPTKAFEAPFTNDLWMVDFSPGPFLRAPDAPKVQATHLCLVIDDHSRLIPFAAYHAQADSQAFHHTLKQAIRRRGIPSKLYTDQGGPFTNDHTKIICANLGIRLLHAKPYHAWSKGKVERMFRTIQDDFENGLRLPGQAVFSLDDLNAKFTRWLQEIYHGRIHSSTGQTPEERFSKQSHQLRLLDPHQDLDRLFYTRLQRVVRKDGTLRLDNQGYEVDLTLRGLEIQLRFDPYRKDRIEVYYREQSFGLARALDLHLNSQLSKPNNYETKR
jgi:putative transposase